MNFNTDDLKVEAHPLIAKTLLYAGLGFLTVWYLLKRYWWLAIIVLYAAVAELVYPEAWRFLYWATIAFAAVAGIGLVTLIVLITIGYLVPREMVAEMFESHVEDVIGGSTVMKQGEREE
jgi:hypothetical protein